MAKPSRIRTESMIDRLGRKPLSEGFEMWDKDYMLGALRLFQCKLEVAPPFEVAACLDAVGEILMCIEEPDEAREHFTQAIDKYKMINKNILSELMRCKSVEIAEGGTQQAALAEATKVLQPFDDRSAEGKKGADLLGAEAKGQGPALGRLYLYRAELRRGLEELEAALKDADMAIELQAERVHLAHGTRGDILMGLGNLEEAIGAYQDAIEAKQTFVAAYESLARALREDGQDGDAIEVIDTVMKLHPKAVLVRDKAFILSNDKKDEEAIGVIDAALKDPPHEETEMVTDGAEGPSALTLRKAKAAILADIGRFEEANAELSKVLAADPEEEEAAMMRKDIHLTLARDYLGRHEIPSYLDSLVAKVLEAKPDAPIAFMIESIEKELKEKEG